MPIHPGVKCESKCQRRLANLNSLFYKWAVRMRHGYPNNTIQAACMLSTSILSVSHPLTTVNRHGIYQDCNLRANPRPPRRPSRFRCESANRRCQRREQLFTRQTLDPRFSRPSSKLHLEITLGRGKNRHETRSFRHCRFQLVRPSHLQRCIPGLLEHCQVPNMPPIPHLRSTSRKFE